MNFEFDAFDEGIEPGGLRSQNEIKLLICWILKSVDQPLTSEEIGNIIQAKAIANYFEAMDAVSDLTEGGIISCDDNNGYSITDKGKSALTITENDLPKTVKEKAVAEAVRILTVKKNAKENEVRVETVKNGYNMTFSLSCDNQNLISLSLFVPDIETVGKLKSNFLSDPVNVYSTILASLMV